MEMFKEKASSIPICFDGDVAVIGGGTAGALAAVAAARQGAKTVLIERMNALGGNMTTNMNIANASGYARGDRRILGGLPFELMKRVFEKGGLPGVSSIEDKLYGSGSRNYTFFNNNVMRSVLVEMCMEAGVQILLQTYFSHVLEMDGERIKGICIVNKAGRFAVLAKAFVDASGDADVAAAAGAPCVSIEEERQYWRDKTLTPALMSISTGRSRPQRNYFSTTKMFEDYGGDFPGKYILFPAGLIALIGNVDGERYKKARFELKPWEKRPELPAIMEKLVGHGVDGKPTIFNEFFDPLTCYINDEEHGVYPPYSPETNAVEKRLCEENHSIPGGLLTLWRDKIVEAAQNGDLDLYRVFPPYGALLLNKDGFSWVPGMKGVVMINCAHLFYDIEDPYSQSMVEIQGQRYIEHMLAFLKKYIPGCEDAYLLQVGQQTVSRASRSILSEQCGCSLSSEKSEEPDGTFGLAGSYDLPVDAPLRLPLGMMTPQKVSNLFVAGKCAAGATCVRDQPTAFAMGEGSGIAAAQVAQTGKDNRHLDLAEYRDRLLAQGVILE